jgi:hypothetical protein
MDHGKANILLVEKAANVRIVIALLLGWVGYEVAPLAELDARLVPFVIIAPYLR